MTTLARTGLDVARSHSGLADGVVVLDAVLRRGVSRRSLERVVSTMQGWPGVESARRAAAFADALAESPLESLGRVRAHEAGLPSPLLQAWVGRDRVDWLWPQEGVVGEADGLSEYDAPRVLRAEKLREDRLRDLGLEVFRFTWRDVAHGSSPLAALAGRAFARAERRGPWRLAAAVAV